MGERFIGGLVADEVGGGGGGGGGEDCLASTAAKGLSVLLLFLAVGIIPSTQSACRRTLWFLDHWTGQRSKEQWTLHFCALSLLQLCIKHVKQIPVNEILQFQSETSWSWKCLFDNWLCTTFFWKILYESSPFGFGKTNENENFVLIFEKVTNVLGEISSHTFLSNIS